jgi:hypothetical protein
VSSEDDGQIVPVPRSIVSADAVYMESMSFDDELQSTLEFANYPLLQESGHLSKAHDHSGETAMDMNEVSMSSAHAAYSHGQSLEEDEAEAQEISDLIAEDVGEVSQVDAHTAYVHDRFVEGSEANSYNAHTWLILEYLLFIDECMATLDPWLDCIISSVSSVLLLLLSFYDTVSFPNRLQTPRVFRSGC